VLSYDALRRQVNELVGEINGQFATPNWTPVVYIRRGIPRPELVALYAVADLAWITPLRDGMNLVAKEFVACKTDEEGVLVLSEFAGAAEEMGEAVIVNPNDEERTAAAVEGALTLAPEERRRRMATLRARVLSKNASRWSEKFLTELQNAAANRGGSHGDLPAPLPVPSLLEAYRSAQRRALLLDYDGTLVGYYDAPADASPQPDLLSVLECLASSKENSVMVVSGRRRNELQQWFGAVTGLWLAAEHGALLHRAGSGRWESLRVDFSREWLERVRPVLQHFVDRTPGSFIEEKEFALVWHYRRAESRFGDWLAQELVAMLEDMLAETELRAIRGRKIVEIRPGWLHKGATARRFLGLCGPVDFQLAFGDDRTDEDLFEALGMASWTVHVGPGSSAARFALAGPAEVVAVLRQLAGEK